MAAKRMSKIEVSYRVDLFKKLKKSTLTTTGKTCVVKSTVVVWSKNFAENTIFLSQTKLIVIFTRSLV